MKSKKTTIFVGPMKCPNCDMISLHYLNLNNKFHDFPYLFAGIPIITKQKSISCGYCDIERKCTKEEVSQCEKALKNKFDDDNVIDGFIFKIKSILKEHNVVENNEIDYDKLDEATNAAFKMFSVSQEYDKEFYYYICLLYAQISVQKDERRKLLFRR